MALLTCNLLTMSSEARTRTQQLLYLKQRSLLYRPSRLQEIQGWEEGYRFRGSQSENPKPQRLRRSIVQCVDTTTHVEVAESQTPDIQALDPHDFEWSSRLNLGHETLKRNPTLHTRYPYRPQHPRCKAPQESRGSRVGY